MTQVKPFRLWVGHAGDACDVRRLHEFGVRAVVQFAAEEPVAQLPREFTVCRFPLHDGEGNDPDILRLAIYAIAAFIELEVPTLVACSAGMSRSPALLAAALYAVLGIPLEAGLRVVAESHPADVSPALWREICRTIAGTDSLTKFLDGIPADLPEELLETLVVSADVRIEWIVSQGHASSPGYWYDQEQDEWVMLLTGAARLLMKGELAPRDMQPGDFVNIPAHRQHRVEWTDPEQPTVWLAVHYPSAC